MAKAMRRWSLLWVGVVAIAISACAKPAVVECGATGVLCPAGTHCAAAQGICLPNTNTCGDAHRDDGEACDDGNTVDGDGCSADCTSDESCGNTKTDTAAGEVCDNGNKTDGDGCSADCTSDESCGNNKIDRAVGEMCDDGNHVNGDDCSADCTSDERCGNGKIDRSVGEVCDPPTDGTCNATCRSVLQCGNAIIDEGEECDDGQGLNGDDKDCRHDCVLNRCGDGFPNLNGTRNHEDCDPAAPAAETDRRAVPVETAGCNLDCSIPSCGDGIVNRSFTPLDGLGPEQCDEGGANADDADCTAHCQVNVCGDHLPNMVGPLHAEGCDDGNRDDHDECTNGCVARTCGDGIVTTTPLNNEQCDLGAANSDTGACLNNCRVAVCGDGKVRTGVEQCDGPAGPQPCSASCRQMICGNGILDPNEECDNGAANSNSADCRLDCVMNRCGDGFKNVTGANPEACDAATPAATGSRVVVPTEAANCNINCTTPACGDTIVNDKFTPIGAPHGEECDDGNIATSDGCSNLCQFEKCGNSRIDPDEECDGAAGLQPCSPSCHQMRCGNGILDPAEECDNGAANDNTADCRLDCVINRCGDGNVNSNGAHHEDCDGGPVAHDGDRTATPTDVANCNSNCTTARCGDSIVNRAFKPTGTTFEQCDNDLVASGSPLAADGCSATCQLETCGNGTRDPNEQCDDGNRNNGDTCENDCTTPRCGNTIEDPGEQCDLGAQNSDAGACTRACRDAVCGDGFVQVATELCDDGNDDVCGSCTSALADPAGNKCARADSAAGTGALIAVAGSALISGTDKLTISDGVNTRTFTFVETGAPSASQVGYADSDTASEVAGNIVAALVASNLHFTAHRFGNVLFLVNNRASVNDGSLTEAVGDAGFAVQDITGGKGGNCGAGVGCHTDNDCNPSLVCRNNTCADP